VGQAHQNLALMREALQIDGECVRRPITLGRCHAANDLERAGLLEATVGALCGVHLAHSAATHQCTDAPNAHAVALCERWRRSAVNGKVLPERLRLEKGVGSPRPTQQLQDLRPDDRIDLLVSERLIPLVGGQIKQGVCKLRDLLPMFCELLHFLSKFSLSNDLYERPSVLTVLEKITITLTNLEYDDDAFSTNAKPA
jgi:hypothetical protein